MNRTGTLAAVLVTLLATTAAMGQGMLVPTDTSLPPLALKSQQVSISIENQVATTTVKQVFQNSTSQQLEANFVFPMPANSTIRDFAMMVDGKRKSGTLVEAAKAREIYTTIVRQARDPGLLEHLGDNLFRVNIFPVPANGTQTVELTYSEVVKASNGVYRYVYPLKTGSKASRVHDFFSIGAKLKSNVPIKSVYSPSHEIGVSRKGDHEAVVGLEQSNVVLERDFSLYWTATEKDFGLSAVAFRPDKDKPGYLMVLLAPKSAVNDDEIIAKDVQFVFDTSGSMGGDKIVQARKALTYCVENLNAKDRFNVVTFSTDVRPLSDGVLEASKENKTKAREFIEAIEAQGGTNIHDALQTALKTARANADRPQIIVFMTDGRPTIGKTGTEEIVGVAEQKTDEKKADEKKADAIRIFTFGVGNDVNTHLLDKVAGGSGGVPEYVKPGEDIEVKVSDFFAKASHPVMTGLSLAFGGEVKVTDMLPKTLPDLYHGQQVVAFARYEGDGDVSVTLGGKVSNGKTEKHVYEVKLPAQGTENDFIEPLWAHRKVGYLLDQIRLNGEEKELKDEVIRLSKAYKIQTPYTSYLVLEDQHEKQYLGEKLAARTGNSGNMYRYRIQARPPASAREPAAAPVISDSVASGPARQQQGQEPRGEAMPAPAETTTARPTSPSADQPAPRAEGEAREADKDGKRLADLMASRRKESPGTDDYLDASGDSMDRAEGGPGGHGGGGAADANAIRGSASLEVNDLKEESGSRAVEMAKFLQEQKSAEVLEKSRDDIASGGKKLAGRVFRYYRGFWVDEKFDPAAKMTFVKWGSDAYFAIVTAHQELKDAFALGENLILATADGKTLVIASESGEEKLSEEQVKQLFEAAAPTTQPEAAEPAEAERQN